MRDADDIDRSSSALARRALLISATLAGAGSALGVLAIVQGALSKIEAILILSSFFASTSVLVLLLVRRRIPLEKLAIGFTLYYTVHLEICIVSTIRSSGENSSLFIYLLWFFPLLVFNRLVNSDRAGRWLAQVILVAPLITLACLLPKLMARLSSDSWFLLGTYCLSYPCFGMMLNVITRYREAYLVEKEHAGLLKLESEILDSISDCFVSLDADLRLIYLNDAACAEFSTSRDKALNCLIPDAVPGFFSQEMLAALRAAHGKHAASSFEAVSDRYAQWYEMRCFPRQDGLSIYFRNITAAVLSRRELEAATAILRERSELLDKAQDAIFVQDMRTRILYWNKGAERIFGWAAEEAIGQRMEDLFDQDRRAIKSAFDTVVRDGEWIGELPKRTKDGHRLIVESRCTLVKTADGTPHAVLVINTDISARKAAEAKVHHLAYYDTLTGLPNRFFLREQLEAMLAAQPEGDFGAVLLIDLDDFKTLNDTSGHDTGDLLLREVALRLKPSTRESFSIARLGGDEFVVTLESLGGDREAATAVARAVGDRSLRASQQPYHLGKLEYHSTLSVGAALFQRCDSVDVVFKRAELALYQAKADGRNTISFFDPAMERRIAARAALRADIRQALLQREFEVYYQPQLARDGTVIGAEALLRWPHPQRGMVSPGEFIPLAEEAGLIGELGAWVLESACNQLATWARVPHMAHLYVAVNVSVLQFLDSQFVQVVGDVLGRTKANPHLLKLEITESTAMEKADETVLKMAALKEVGVGFSLDDFGTGYSSLSRLKNLPLEQLKIDQSFVRDALSGPMDISILRTIIALGKNLNLRLVAEGVETEEQRSFLENEGCDAYQGFLFSKALPIAAFEAYVTPRVSAAADFCTDDVVS